MKYLALSIIAAALILISGCAQLEPVPARPVTSDVCGDGVCSAIEQANNNCESDCPTVANAEPERLILPEEKSNNCIGEGEKMPATDSAPKCCAGLDLIIPKESTEKGFKGFCTGLCGNGVCDSLTESQKNCPSDCQTIADSQPSCDGQGTPKEGWYQNDKILFYVKCSGCEAECRNKGTASEGWYSTCNNKQIKRICG